MKHQLPLVTNNGCFPFGGVPGIVCPSVVERDEHLIVVDSLGVRRDKYVDTYTWGEKAWMRGGLTEVRTNDFILKWNEDHIQVWRVNDIRRMRKSCNRFVCFMDAWADGNSIALIELVADYSQPWNEENIKMIQEHIKEGVTA